MASPKDSAPVVDSNRTGVSELASTENKGKAGAFALSPSH